ncbi:glycosyltransferase, partial [Alphaproteobacteria bacterium]|nr:glycosyltransferase [Alphaproteobacteria bacterium]
FITNNINNLKNYKPRKPGPLRLIFLSRISPMKNLKFLLEVLTKINTKIEFSIYGPKSDSKYWQECFVLIQRLSSNIKIDIHGEILHKEVLSIFNKYDLFVFPTLGENFGHVIFESLQAGTPVLVSDKTPWLDNNMGGLHLISLDQDKWVKIITEWSKLDSQKLLQKRKETFEYLINLNHNNKSLNQNKILFNSVLNENIIV